MFKMRINPYFSTFILAIGLFLTSCIVSNPKFFSEVKSTEDPSYGYTAENPMAIKNTDLTTSIGSSYYYLWRLRTEKGNKFHVLERFTMDNPNYKKPAIPQKNKHTGPPLIYGKGVLIDGYILVSENENDTIVLYVNPYLKGDVMIPVKLKFEKE